MNKKGFSLIELLIVVAIILIIAAIAIPNLLRAKMSANESAAAANLRTVASAEITYASTYSVGFTPSLFQLCGGLVPADSTQADLLDGSLCGLAGGAGTMLVVKGGYTYTYLPVGVPQASFTVTAQPVAPGSSGANFFCTDAGAAIYKADPIPAAVPAGLGTTCTLSSATYKAM